MMDPNQLQMLINAMQTRGMGGMQPSAAMMGGNPLMQTGGPGQLPPGYGGMMGGGGMGGGMNPMLLARMLGMGGGMGGMGGMMGGMGGGMGPWGGMGGGMSPWAALMGRQMGAPTGTNQVPGGGVMGTGMSLADMLRSGGYGGMTAMGGPAPGNMGMDLTPKPYDTPRVLPPTMGGYGGMTAMGGPAPGNMGLIPKDYATPRVLGAY